MSRSPSPRPSPSGRGSPVGPSNKVPIAPRISQRSRNAHPLLGERPAPTPAPLVAPKVIHGRRGEAFASLSITTER